MKQIFQNFYHQDTIYLSNVMMENALEQRDIFPGGFSLSFQQNFNENEEFDTQEID